MIDLHIHSTYSDGTNTPLEILKLAEKLNLSQIAITDHNCIDGALEALEFIDKFSFDFIIGCELTCMYKNKEVHLLGYFDKNNNEFDSLYSFIKLSEDNKVIAQEKMLENLKRYGFKFTLTELKERFPDTIINRVHIARMLCDKGYTSSIDEVFDKYIGEGKPCYVQRKCPELSDAVNAVHSCNGIAVLAHPFQYTKTEIEVFLADAIKIIDGIEALHSSHNKNQIKELTKIAQKHKKIITGGSDFHGTVKPDVSIGCCAVPDKYKLIVTSN
ncbi:MAG: PHP domain-containing protein [Ruminococcus sp.]|nr:PHP domain-containing protein [Ruminococcus sp.]